MSEEEYKKFIENLKKEKPKESSTKTRREAAELAKGANSRPTNEGKLEKIKLDVP